jgi:MarR family transcriptional repressor of emrRAB
VRNSKRARTANLLAAAATGLADAMADSVRAAGGLDLTAATALVAMLDFTPHGSVEALSRVVGVTHSGAVRLADRLVAAGLVDRRTGADARSRVLSLTGDGRVVAERVRAARQSAMDEVLGGLSSADQTALSTLCEQLVQRLTTLRLQQRASGEQPAGGALCRLCDFSACGRDRGACPAARTVSRRR